MQRYHHVDGVFGEINGADCHSGELGSAISTFGDVHGAPETPKIGSLEIIGTFLIVANTSGGAGPRSSATSGKSTGYVPATSKS